MAQGLEDKAAADKEAWPHVKLPPWHEMLRWLQCVLNAQLAASSPNGHRHARAHPAKVARCSKVQAAAEQFTEAMIVKCAAVEPQQDVALLHRQRHCVIGSRMVKPADENTAAIAHPQRASQRRRLQRLVIAAQRGHAQAPRQFSPLRGKIRDLLEEALDQRRGHGVALQLDPTHHQFLEGHPYDPRCGNIHERTPAVATVDSRVDSERQASSQGVRILLHFHTANDALSDAASVPAHRVAHHADLVKNYW
mmetsp:Transcript_117928/g.328552  ORF Transcript_117928/g.328552 Transcript_117928/m.328552 type:complete len:251 (+) Transcript_117928:481-1233(+)